MFHLSRDLLLRTRLAVAKQRGGVGLVFKAHRLYVSLNSRLESNKEEEEVRVPSLSNHTVWSTRVSFPSNLRGT